MAGKRHVNIRSENCPGRENFPSQGSIVQLGIHIACGAIKSANASQRDK
jgi:hypothetical protein